VPSLTLRPRDMGQVGLPQQQRALRPPSCHAVIEDGIEEFLPQGIEWVHPGQWKVGAPVVAAASDSDGVRILVTRDRRQGNLDFAADALGGMDYWADFVRALRALNKSIMFGACVLLEGQRESLGPHLFDRDALRMARAPQAPGLTWSLTPSPPSRSSSSARRHKLVHSLVATRGGCRRAGRSF
jgi:hypothetical protein